MQRSTMTPGCYYLIFATILLHHYQFAAAYSIQGCGGFVEASSALMKSRKPTDAKLDYSHITVELRTLEGLVKDSTQSAPNGYYFIPVYDKGSYVIKVRGPDGWKCDPEQVPVVVDDTGCNANEDINFRFTGFTVYGRIVGATSGDSCSLKDSGPSGVNVELLSPSGDVVSSVSSTSAGSYSFKNIIPGKYKIRASRHDLNIETTGSDEVELGFDNGIVNDIFFVNGYDIRGYVVAQGNPILGVHFFLYSDDVAEVDCPYDSSSAPGLGKALCHAASDADGMFTFTAIPCGIYKLIPFYKGENTVFDVSPPSMLVSVQHDHVKVPQKFQVTGFSIGGRVVDGNGIGVDAAKIIVNGNERSITDKEGNYKLDQVTSKRYTIVAEKEHYKFAILDDFLVLPNMTSIIDIQAVSYDICGMAHTITSAYKVKVALTHGPDNVKPQMKQTDERGNFCFEVQPGEYRLSAFAATPESASELQFSPPYIDVSVDKPLLNMMFSQAQVNVNGSVICMDKCGSSVSIILVRLDGKAKEDARTMSLSDKSSDFSFPNVLPGKYRLEVKNYSPGNTSGEDTWCWKQNFINVDVGVNDAEGITFIQRGYWVSIISSHEVDAYLIQEDDYRLNFTIKKGSQQICVESPGVHELHFVNPCIWFGSASLRVDTSNSLPVNLKGEKYLLRGHIYVGSNENLPEHITIDILDNQDNLVDVTVAGLVSAETDQPKAAATYEYSVWAIFGEELNFLPRDSRNNVEKKILFYPRKHQVLEAQGGCQVPISPFSGRLGLYIEGSVLPPTSHVHIRILAERASEVSQLDQEDVALETFTEDNGLFLVGPLYDDISYKIMATKPGYSIKQVGQNLFSCQKLGQLSVQLCSVEDRNEPLPSVLLSLSGEDGYRNNSLTGIGGVFLFDNLLPGSFYLRPLLKEYVFSPPAEAINLGSGDSREIVFHATRDAFSAFGKVTLLSGQPKEGVSVEARAESKGFYEETTTDMSGNYRLRGLHPDTTYVIKIAKKSEIDGNFIERASPEFLSVKIGYEDIKELDFVVFELPDVTILSGHVEGKNIMELHSQISVEIRSLSEPSKIESIFPLPISNFFQVKDLPKGKHFLQLRLATPSSTQTFKSEIIEADLEREPQVHVGPLSCNIEDIHKQELTPPPVYPLVVGLSVIALFACVPRLKDLYQALVELSTSGYSTTAKKDAKKLMVRKKTNSL